MDQRRKMEAELQAQVAHRGKLLEMERLRAEGAARKRAATAARHKAVQAKVAEKNKAAQARKDHIMLQSDTDQRVAASVTKAMLLQQQSVRRAETSSVAESRAQSARTVQRQQTVARLEVHDNIEQQHWESLYRQQLRHQYQVADNEACINHGIDVDTGLQAVEDAKETSRQKRQLFEKWQMQEKDSQWNDALADKSRIQAENSAWRESQKQRIAIKEQNLANAQKSARARVLEKRFADQLGLPVMKPNVSGSFVMAGGGTTVPPLGRGTSTLGTHSLPGRASPGGTSKASQSRLRFVSSKSPAGPS
eukprot:gene8833-biopygen6705